MLMEYINEAFIRGQNSDASWTKQILTNSCFTCSECAMIMKGTKMSSFKNECRDYLKKRSCLRFSFKKFTTSSSLAYLGICASLIFSFVIILNQTPMPLKNSYSLQKRKYAQISVKKRVVLVQLVLQDGKSLAEASRKLNIKPSTAKLIVKKYQQTGKFFMKKLKNASKKPLGVLNTSNEQEIKVKIEEKEDLTYGHKDQEKLKVLEEQKHMIWYGYNHCPWNYQYTYQNV